MVYILVSGLLISVKISVNRYEMEWSQVRLRIFLIDKPPTSHLVVPKLLVMLASLNS